MTVDLSSKPSFSERKEVARDILSKSERQQKLLEKVRLNQSNQDFSSDQGCEEVLYQFSSPVNLKDSDNNVPSHLENAEIISGSFNFMENDTNVPSHVKNDESNNDLCNASLRKRT